MPSSTVKKPEPDQKVNRLTETMNNGAENCIYDDLLLKELEKENKSKS